MADMLPNRDQQRSATAHNTRPRTLRDTDEIQCAMEKTPRGIDTRIPLAALAAGVAAWMGGAGDTSDHRGGSLIFRPALLRR